MLSEGALFARCRRDVLEGSSKERPDVSCLCLEVRCLLVEKLLSGGALIVLRKETGSLMRPAAFPASGMSRGTLHCMAVPRIGGSGTVTARTAVPAGQVYRQPRMPTGQVYAQPWTPGPVMQAEEK